MIYLSYLKIFSDTILNDNSIDLPKVTADSTSLENMLAIVFGITGAIAFLIVVIAGFQFVISSGDPQKVSKARQTILYAVVGIVVSATAFTIVKFVLGSS